jgi:thiol-disulfide isomerase/thioredoxin
MRVLPVLLVLAMRLAAQPDPAGEAYRSWDKAHPGQDYRARMQSLFEASAEWVANWPDSKFAWEQRRSAMLVTGGSPELWKQVDDNLLRLNPPHTRSLGVAEDWIRVGGHPKEAEALLLNELSWIDAQPKSARPDHPTLENLIEEGQDSFKAFGYLCVLAEVQTSLKEFDAARATIGRVHALLEGPFKDYYDQDPLEAFPDNWSKYYTLSAQLAQAEGRTADALAFFQKVVANPYFQREYKNGWVKAAQPLWKQAGGTDDGWAEFAKVSPLPEGTPSGYQGLPLLPWLAMDYKLPEMNEPWLGPAWSAKDFGGKTTMVYLWASWCAPCWSHLPGVQALYDRIKDRKDIQILTLSVDEDPEKLAAFMKEKGYTFPVAASKPYVNTLLPHPMLGQHWIVDKNASVRLVRVWSMFNGADQAFIDEAIYKLNQVSARTR